MSYSFCDIHPEAEIGENVIIDPFVTVEKNVVIGSGTHLFSHAVVMEGARIGKDCKIFPGAVIAAIPQDMKFAGEWSTVEIGDRTTIRECATVNRGTAARGVTNIGSDSLVMAYCHVAHDCNIGNHVILTNACQLAGEVTVDDYAILGGMCAVHQFSHIGSYVMIGGGTLVRKDVPPYVLAAREPICYCGLNTVGLRRRGFSSERIDLLQSVYRLIYQSHLTVSEALERIREEVPECEERDAVLRFVSESKRGIIKGELD